MTQLVPKKVVLFWNVLLRMGKKKKERNGPQHGLIGRAVFLPA